jgi:CBS domain-containing protein
MWCMAGLVTLRQLVNAMHHMGAAMLSAKAADVMNPEPVIASPAMSGDELRAVMAKTKVTHVPVLDGDKVVGILSFHDVARAELSQTEFENALLKKYIKNWPE